MLISSKLVRAVTRIAQEDSVGLNNCLGHRVHDIDVTNQSYSSKSIDNPVEQALRLREGCKIRC